MLVRRKSITLEYNLPELVLGCVLGRTLHFNCLDKTCVSFRALDKTVPCLELGQVTLTKRVCSLSGCGCVCSLYECWMEHDLEERTVKE